MKDKLLDCLKRAIKDRVFPGAVLGISHRGQRTILHAGRYTYDTNSPAVAFDTVYDLASVTKSVATSAVILKLINESRISLEDKVSTHLPEFNDDPFKKEVTIWHLLTYTIELDLPSIKTFLKLTPDDILAKLFSARLVSLEKKYHYTNQTAIILGEVAKRVTGKPLNVLAEDFFYRPLGMASTSFYTKDISHVAPTEIDPETGKVLQGVVHDEGTRALAEKYITGAAGLFGNVPDLLTFMEMLLANGDYKDRKYFSHNLVNEMHTNQLGHINESAGLGWEMGREWMGATGSASAFGKSGFTGTSVYADPEKDLAIVLLSNRVYPKRPENSEAINKIRREVIEIILTEV